MDEHGIVSRDDWGPTCARCGDPEFRIDGFCSIYCRDMAELEAEIKRLEVIERQAIEQSEYVQAHGLTEYEMARKDARIDELEGHLEEINQAIIHYLSRYPAAPALRCDTAVEALNMFVEYADAERDALKAQLDDAELHLDLNLDVVAEQQRELCDLRAQLAEWQASK